MNKLWKVVIICVGIIAAILLYLRYEKTNTEESEGTVEFEKVTATEETDLVQSGEACSGFSEQQKEELRAIIAEVIESSFEEQVKTSVEDALKNSLDSMLEDGRLGASVTEYVSIQSSLININTADVEELTKLTGIGQAKAKAIVAYREEHGPFSEIGELANVSGISTGTIEKFKDQVTL